MKRTPRPLGHHATILTEEQTARVTRFVSRVGVKQARKLLGVSPQTLDNARFFGRLSTETAHRIVLAVEQRDATRDAGGDSRGDSHGESHGVSLRDTLRDGAT